MGRRLRKGGLAVAAAVLALLSVELWLRHSPPGVPLPPPPPPREIDPYGPNPYIVSLAPFIALHLPGSRYWPVRGSVRVEYRINSRGFRGPEAGAHPPPGQRRLLVLGDSITEGFGVEFGEAFPARLGEMLKGEWEVVNAGMQGASPAYYAANLARYLALHPDALLLVLFENDLYEDRVREADFPQLPWLTESEYRRLGLPPPDPGRWRTWTLLRRALGMSCSPVERLLRENRRAFSAADWSVLRSFGEGLQGGGYLVPPQQMDKQWRLSLAYLDLLVQSCRERGLPLLVVGLSLSSLQQKGEAFAQHARDFHRFLRVWTAGQGLPYLWLTEVLAGHLSPGAGISLPGDPHPDARTHRLMAELLLPWLRRHLPP